MLHYFCLHNHLSCEIKIFLRKKRDFPEFQQFRKRIILLKTQFMLPLSFFSFIPALSCKTGYYSGYFIAHHWICETLVLNLRLQWEKRQATHSLFKVLHYAKVGFCLKSTGNPTRIRYTLTRNRTNPEVKEN